MHNANVISKYDGNVKTQMDSNKHKQTHGSLKWEQIF